MNSKIANRSTITIAFFVLAAIYFLVNLGIKQPVLAGALKLAPTLVFFVSVLIVRYGLREPFVMQYKSAISYAVVIAVGSSIVGDLAGEFKPVYGNSALLFQIFFFAIAQIFYSISFLHYCGKRRIGTSTKTERIVKSILITILVLYLVLVAATVIVEVEMVYVEIAIFIYMVLIATMSILSIVQRRPDQPWFIAGAFLFCISDSLIAINTFLKPVPCASFLIMSTYFLAQYCLNIRLFPKR